MVYSVYEKIYENPPLFVPLVLFFVCSRQVFLNRSDAVIYIRFFFYLFYLPLCCLSPLHLIDAMMSGSYLVGKELVILPAQRVVKHNCNI